VLTHTLELGSILGQWSVLLFEVRIAFLDLWFLHYMDGKKKILNGQWSLVRVLILSTRAGFNDQEWFFSLKLYHTSHLIFDITLYKVTFTVSYPSFRPSHFGCLNFFICLSRVRSMAP